ncbi:MAG TPA: tRNA pseudouridine(38-40) synthase TruA [Geobacteraceae bacterium]
MRNIKLIIEYDGTNYAGWQVQPNGLAIQQVMEDALARILGAPARLHSSGRTDAGVHARGMVAAFRTDRDIPLRAFSDGLNSLLPPDIAVKDATEASPEFHPRFDATGKRYRYTVYNGGRRSPLARLYAWHLRGELNMAAMEEGARHFIGEHDFAAFRTAGCAAKTTVRRIDAIALRREGDFIYLDVTGSGFLRNMVRIMAGTLVEVGQGRRSPGVVAALLSGDAGVSPGATAPPHGLCLMEVFY